MNELVKFYKNFDDDFSTRTQFILTSDGLFKKQKLNPITFIYKRVGEFKIDSFNIESSYPAKLSEEPKVLFKVPSALKACILSAFRKFAKDRLELRINIWFDTISKEFFLDVPLQFVSWSSIYAYPPHYRNILWSESFASKHEKALKLKEKVERHEAFMFLDNHSHHNMKSLFSRIDDYHDFYDNDRISACLFSVFGEVLSSPDINLRYFMKEKPESTIKESVVYFDENCIFDDSVSNYLSFNLSEFESNIFPYDLEFLNWALEKNNPFLNV